MATRSVTSVGLGLGALSAATFGTSGVFAKALSSAGWSAAAAVTLRIGLAALILTVPALLQLRGRWGMLRRAARPVLGYGFIAMAGCQLSYFNAVQHISISVALLIEYSGTVLVVLWLWLRHGQRPRRLTVFGAAVAIAGLCLALDLTGNQQINLVGVLWACGGAAGLAFYFLISAHSGDALPPVVMAWAGMVVGGLVLAVLSLSGAAKFHIATGSVDFAGHHANWLVAALGLALIPTVIAYSLGITAARQLGAKLASFVGLSEVLFATLTAWAVLGQRPTALQAVGGVIVLVGIALVRADEAEVDEIVPSVAADLPLPAPS
jgi:drug/metabolite transporter (DMT)-like permease